MSGHCAEHRAPESRAIHQDAREQGPVSATGGDPGTLRKGAQTISALAAIYDHPFFGDALQVRAWLVGRPKDLLVRLRLAEVQKAQAGLSDIDVAAKCAQKVAQYEGTDPNKPALAKATDKAWKDKVALQMPGIKAADPRPSVPAWLRCRSKKPGMSS